jgi:hypothetical protein
LKPSLPPGGGAVDAEEITVPAAATPVTSRIRALTNLLVAPTRNFVLAAKGAATPTRSRAAGSPRPFAVYGRPDDYAVAGSTLSNTASFVHRSVRGCVAEGHIVDRRRRGRGSVRVQGSWQMLLLV